MLIISAICFCFFVGGFGDWTRVSWARALALRYIPALPFFGSLGLLEYKRALEMREDLWKTLSHCSSKERHDLAEGLKRALGPNSVHWVWEGLYSDGKLPKPPHTVYRFPSVLVSFPVAVIKCPRINNLKEKGLIWLPNSRLWSVVGGQDVRTCPTPSQEQTAMN